MYRPACSAVTPKCPPSQTAAVLVTKVPSERRAACAQADQPAPYMQSPGEPGGSETAHAIDEGKPMKLLAGPTLVITLPSGLTLQMVELGLALVVPLPKLPYPADPVSCIVPSGIVTKGWV